jgi:uncharacterized OsmC-like protein
MTKPVKRWSVNAVSAGQTPLALFCDGRTLGRATAAPDNLSPVEYLLISIASCFAFSCRAVLSRRKLINISFEVVAIGEKAGGTALDQDDHIGEISVVAIFGGEITESMAAQITEQAKPLCTITNTLMESPNIAFRSRAIKECRSGFYELPAGGTATPS